MKTRLLVTGASGFIGRNLFEHFSQKEDIELFGTYNTRLPVPLNHMHRGDLTREEVVRDLFTEVKPRVLIHAAAATTSFHEFKKNEGILIHANVLMNTNIIALAAECNIPHVILLSCALVYPSADSIVEEEDATIPPLENSYSGGAKVKLTLEDFARQYAQMSNGRTAYTIVRHSNMYGSYDKFHGGGHLVASKIAEIAKAKDNDTITVRGYGTEQRDLLHVDDLAHFIDIASHKENPRTDVWNVGYGSSLSVNEIVRKIVGASGKKLEIVNDVSVNSAPTQPALNCKKAKDSLCWEPKINLDDGIRMTMEWYKAQKSL